MSLSENRTVEVHFLPRLIPAGALNGGVAVVIDVLRATSVMVQALASGSEAVVPCLEIDEATRIAEGFPEGAALLAGERQGVAIEGFQFGNSPGDFSPEVCRGKTVVMTTTNGTRAILASTEADRVLIGAFTNLSAIRAALRSESRPVHLVCSGTDGLISFEDTLLAGALVYEMERSGERSPGNDAARIARRSWMGSLGEASELGQLLMHGRGGRRVTELGLEKDIIAASEVDTIGIVPELRRDPFRIASAGATESGVIG